MVRARNVFRLLIFTALSVGSGGMPLRADPAAASAAIESKPLFDGTGLNGWRPREPDKANTWGAVSGVLLNTATGSDLVTAESFGDFEFLCEYKLQAHGRGGIFLRGRYEICLEDDSGSAPGFQSSGAIRSLICPGENAAMKADKWQALDVTVTGKTVTVILNGKKVIPEIMLPHPTAGALDTNADQPGPIMLKGGSKAVAYRNLHIKPLPPSGDAVQITGTFGTRFPPEALLKLDETARDEFDKSHPGVLPDAPLRARLPFPSEKAFNWCTFNQDFFVHNQGPSSSCWAHTAIEALECNWLMRNGIRHPFSPQPVLDYSQRANGGSSSVAFDVLLKHGTGLLPEYAFNGQPGKVRNKIPTRFRAIAWGRVGDGHTPPTVDQIKAALLEHGPLAINLFSTPAFQKYTTGVFAEHYKPVKPEPAHNHEVLLLGWDDKRGKGAWYIKNSWGEKWGDRGYCWIEYGCNNVCYDVWWVTAQSTYYPLPKEDFLKLVPDAAPPMSWTSPVAPIAEVKTVTLEHNVVQKGVKGTVFHVNAEIRRAKGKKALVAVCLMDENGKFLSPTPANTAYTSPDGHLCASASVVPPGDDSSFNDLALFLPFNQLTLRAGPNPFQYQVTISCDGKPLSMNRQFRGSFKVTHNPPAAQVNPAN